MKFPPQGLNLVAKYSSEFWASKQAHRNAPKSPCPPHKPEIKDYGSTLAASKLIILFLEILKFSKMLFLKNNFLWKKVKNLLKYFIFNMKSSNLIKLFKRHALKLPCYSCNSLQYINIRNWFLWWKRTTMQSFWAFFLVKFSVAINMPKVVGLTVVFSSIYSFMRRPGKFSFKYPTQNQFLEVPFICETKTKIVLI